MWLKLFCRPTTNFRMHLYLGDRGFTCDDVLAQKKARLITPDYVPTGMTKLPEKALRRTQVIAVARVPIERFNERMKNFEFVGDSGGPVDHSKLCVLKEATYVCGVLANFSRCLVEN